MLPPLKVSYELFLGFDGDRKYRCDLNSAEDFMQKCVENLCDTFKFAFEIPLPDIDSDLQRHSSQLSQIVSFLKELVGSILTILLFI